MIRGLYTSALGMTVQMKKMDITSNNIANSDTTGFKRDISVTQSFSEVLMKRLYDPASYAYHQDRATGNVALGLFVDQVRTDFSIGGFKQTGGNLDVAIAGDGFFNVQYVGTTGQNEIKYTRDGSFSMGADGSLLTKEGYRVMGQNGPIVLPQGMMTMNQNGDIYVNDVFIDTVQITDFENKDSLRKMGDNLYETTKESRAIPFQGRLEQGYLESSNINTVKEMVELIAISRAYEANQKIVTMIDTTMGQAVNDVGRK